ncbi:hypothetical protein LK994_07345 [Ferruginibacter lapsinanis]|uniref:hypothetical protein n=1 Tax=Ferruginibacter lapsinanis TaxID=563172 RepID=UPI001E2F7D6B|nr:hypothetical protein [Ferruginibacter lapsinanis]UEG51283.1 hypothetical protein LK994_07345 [Ferruginibacter lapsinanis]
MDTEELKHRINNALILLADGHSLKVGDLTFGCRDKTNFSVSGWTNNILLENVTRQSALTELNDIKSLFSKMVDTSNELADFIKNKQIIYYLGYDYGMGSIGICNKKNGQLKWETELRD